MITFLTGVTVGLAMGAAAFTITREYLVPRRLLQLFSAIPKTMRFDLATAQSMRNMVVLAEPSLAAVFTERHAERMLKELRTRLPDRKADKAPLWRRHTSAHPSVAYFPTSPPPTGTTLPAECSPLDAVLISWPWHYTSRWTHHANWARAIAAANARVIILSDDQQDQAELREYLNVAGLPLDRIEILEAPVEDVWIRDYGPTFVRKPDGGAALIANPYVPAEHPYRKGDNSVSFVLGASLGLPVFRLPLQIEGGNLVSDGHGLMITSTATLDRNPELSRDDVAAIFAQYFGCNRTEFIPALPAEVTGHADMVVRFVDATTAVIASAPAGHRWAGYLDTVATQISNLKNAHGAPYAVHRLPIAVSSRYASAFWSYVNCIQVNGTTIVPVFGEATDSVALAFFRSLDMGPVVGIDFSDFLVGSVHCQSKEIFRGALSKAGPLPGALA